MAASIERGSVSTVIVKLKTDVGTPLAIGPADQFSWALITFDGHFITGSQTSFDLNAPGTIRPKGQLVASVDLVSGSYKDEVEALDKCILVVNTVYGRQMTELAVMNAFQLTTSQLFVKELVIPQMRQDQLLTAAAGALRDVRVTDDYLWTKLIAAEAEIGRRLRVFLVPTRIFQSDPTPAEIAALNGKPWVKDTPQDYEPSMFDRDKWGLFVTRHHPIVSVDRLRFIMPSAGGSYFDIPDEWQRIDRKYGYVEILPVTNASLITTSVLGFTALTWQSRIPQMVHLDYTAGLSDVATKYPDLLDAIKKLAVTKIITDSFLPQSGSISADGLSESMSVDVSKYNDLVDRIIDGGDAGGNGGLMAAIHGIKMMVC